MCINLNILECKLSNVLCGQYFFASINLNILECKSFTYERLTLTYKY